MNNGIRIAYKNYIHSLENFAAEAYNCTKVERKDDMTRICYLCGRYFTDTPFENMNTAGESTTSKIVLFDREHTVCPKCTRKLYSWIKEEQQNENCKQS